MKPIDISNFWKEQQRIAKNINEGWEPDFSEINKRWYIYYNEATNKFCFGYEYLFLYDDCHEDCIFFRNYEAFKKFMANFDFDYAEHIFLETDFNYSYFDETRERF